MFDETLVAFARTPWNGASERAGRPSTRESRVLIEPDCGARTSIYNRNDTCWLHAAPSYPIPPGYAEGAVARYSTCARRVGTPAQTTAAPHAAHRLEPASDRGRLSHLLLGTRHLGLARIPWGCSLGWGDVLIVCPEPRIVERHD
jgi:hypothetical protein